MTTPTARIDWRSVWTIALGILAGTVAAAGTVAVAVAGFTLSYDAIRTVGISAHIRPGWAWLLPVSVDGAMAVATVAAVVVRQMTDRTAWYPWLVVVTGALISIACNGLHATGQLLDNDVVRFAVSAIPALMLTLSVHLLVTLILLSRQSVSQSPGDASTGAESDMPPTVSAQVAAEIGVAADVAPPAIAALPIVSGQVSLVRPYVATSGVAQAVATGDATADTDMTREPTRAATSDVAVKVAGADRKVSRPVSQSSDTGKVKVARRRVARGDSCASVARDINVSAKTVERWTADIRAARAVPAPPKVNGSADHPTLTGVTS